MLRPTLFLLAAHFGLASTAFAQGEARDSALDAFAMEFYRDNVASPPDALAMSFQDACDKGYNPACRRNNWFVDGKASLALAADTLLPSCESGDPVACIVVGWHNEAVADKASTRDQALRGIKRAARYYKQHCDEGYGPACTDYARLIYTTPALGADPRAAVKRWQDACVQGESAACNTLAKLHITGGPAVAQSSRSALDYAKRACDGAYPEGCSTLGGLQQADWDNSKRDEFYGGLCEQGHRDSCWSLARTYFDGIHPEPSEGRAQSLFSRACDLGHPRACFESGRHFGEGQSTDDVKAAEYYSKACDLGTPAGCDSFVDMVLSERAPGSIKQSANAFMVACEDRESKRACAVLGLALIDGTDIPRDAPRGRSMLHKACPDETSEPTACASLGRSYEEGLGGDRDRTEASRFFRWACIGGHADSCQRRGDLLISDVGVRRDDHEALNMYERACTAGSPKACFSGGVILDEATYVTKDAERASGLYRAACDGSDGRGCLGLGRLYEEGIQGAPEFEAARAAYEEAVALNSTGGKAALSRMLWRGQGGRKDKGRARKLAFEACKAGTVPACKGPAFL